MRYCGVGNDAPKSGRSSESGPIMAILEDVQAWSRWNKWRNVGLILNFKLWKQATLFILITPVLSLKQCELF
jgi:hypothetical protein